MAVYESLFKSGRDIVPMLLYPCSFCEKKRELSKTTDDEYELDRLIDNCRASCEDFEYFEKYGINRLAHPCIEDTDYLIEMIGFLMNRIENSGKTDIDVARLEAAGDRLGFVLNLEEARIEAAINCISH